MYVKLAQSNSPRLSCKNEVLSLSFTISHSPDMALGEHQGACTTLMETVKVRDFKISTYTEMGYLIRIN